MPGFVIPGVTALTSGGVNLLGTNFWSGQGAQRPVGGLQLFADASNSGRVFIGFSGGITMNSGGLNTSGLPNMSGAMDGTPLGAGAAYFVPRMVFNPVSGASRLFAIADAACSGVARLLVEGF